VMRPCIVDFAKWPGKFVVGNMPNATLNTAFRQLTWYPKSMTPWGKVMYLFTDILLQPGTLPAAAALVFVAALARRALRRGDNANRFRLEISLLVLLSLSLIVAGVAPTPLFVPYFFSPLVFLLLLGVY